MEQVLDLLRADYRAVTGSPFSHFYCPILFRDEDVELCRAHIVNRAFPNSNKTWTVQRADVDNFYGGMFEADFVALQYRGKKLADHIIVDPDLSKKLRPKIQIGGEVVQHFLAHGPVPKCFTEAVVAGPSGPVRLGLKIHPHGASAAISKGCQILIEKDGRLPALASLLKAAHLMLFEMLGYRYALSLGDRFLGQTVLGDFFLRNNGSSKAVVLADAKSHFSEFSNMMRPVLGATAEDQRTLTDRFLYVCRCQDETPWALMVFIRTSDLLHAVIVPVLDSENAAVRFMTFLRGDGCAIRANPCRFEAEQFFGGNQSESLVWPKAEFL